MYEYAIIGNCQVSAHISSLGSIDWLCMPRPDSPPIFGRLLDPEGGAFSIEPVLEFSATQEYIQHTNILVTHFKLADGSEFKLTDFCPRFFDHNRMIRPTMVARLLEPIKGEPRIRVRCQPVNGWHKSPTPANQGSSHLTWRNENGDLHLTTNQSLTYIMQGSDFLLDTKSYFVLNWNIIEHDINQRYVDDHLNATKIYWETWVKHCSLPTLFQNETIRSALALKLHCYEDTGAILAALTTSLPEEIGGTRNWDYRFCWLRDAYFSLSAFNALGHFEEMEGFIRFLLNVAANCDLLKDGLGPVYTLDHKKPIPEMIHSNWSGYHNSRPVRSENQAAEQPQHDVYGEMVLSLSPVFFDARFVQFRTPEVEHLLERLVKLCSQHISKSDAGPWEIRSGWQEHSFSNLACWAGLERAARLQKIGFLKDVSIDVGGELQRVDKALAAATKNGSLRNGPHDDSFDASLLLLPVFRYADVAVSERTVNEIRAQLEIEGEPGFLRRYTRVDDVGVPQSAFVICSFWLAQALARLGHRVEAAEILDRLNKSSNSLGLFSEHFDPKLVKQTGNFPQSYSHVGQINAAFAVSPQWSEIL